MRQLVKQRLQQEMALRSRTRAAKEVAGAAKVEAEEEVAVMKRRSELEFAGTIARCKRRRQAPCECTACIHCTQSRSMMIADAPPPPSDTELLSNLKMKQ